MKRTAEMIVTVAGRVIFNSRHFMLCKKRKGTYKSNCLTAVKRAG